jgi:hypothetical protein
VADRLAHALGAERPQLRRHLHQHGLDRRTRSEAGSPWSSSVADSTVDMSGTNTTLEQIAAEAFGVPVEQVRVINADTESAPYAGASGGGKITTPSGRRCSAPPSGSRRQSRRWDSRSIFARGG